MTPPAQTTPSPTPTTQKPATTTLLLQKTHNRKTALLPHLIPTAPNNMALHHPTITPSVPASPFAAIAADHTITAVLTAITAVEEAGAVAEDDAAVDPNAVSEASP